jgi:pyruvate/oxaloacetate carboxyltransferase
MAILTTTEYRDKTPDDVLEIVTNLADKMYEDATPKGGIVNPQELEEVLLGQKTFDRELTSLLNRYNVEGRYGNTPDFHLASLITGMLDVYGKTVHDRDKWFGIDPWDKNKSHDTAPEEATANV